MSARIEKRFAALKQEGRAALVTFTMAGDPDYATSLALTKALPKAGADVLELGMPFTDPMADGPSVQAAGLRALHAGQDMIKTLALVREFRQGDNDTPIVLMGYYNPIYIYGVDKFLADAKAVGVDGLIVVDLPPEEDNELCLPALRTPKPTATGSLVWRLMRATASLTRAGSAVAAPVMPVIET